MKRIVIVGAGVAGLTLGRLMREKGHETVLLEKETTPGGLARSFRYGQYVFDIGPHRFHTEDTRTSAFIRSVLAGNAMMIGRNSAIRFRGRYFRWPFRTADFLRLPLGLGLSALADLLRKKPSSCSTYREYILRNYGPTIYRNFFEGYTRKFLKVDPDELHPEWGRVSIDRAAIDRKVRASSTGEIVRGAFLKRPVRTRFIYPVSGGTGSFTDALAGSFTADGGRLFTSMSVRELETAGGLVKAVITSTGKRLDTDELVWTAPVTELAELLRMEPVGLRYLDTVIYNIECSARPVQSYQWCYFGDEQTCFVRYSVPSLFSARNAPSGGYGICCEVTCPRESPTWRDPQSLAEEVVQGLIRTRVITDRSAIGRINIEKIPNTYPVYLLGFKEEFSRLRGRMSAFRNIRLLGRCAAFWYNNMDQSIKQAFEMAELIT